jgi:anti-sigma factor RsiW
MNCQQTAELLSGYVDNELDPVRSLEFQKHLAECQTCARCYEEQLALRKVLTNQAQYFQAPKAVVRDVRTALREAHRTQETQPRGAWDFRGLWLKILAPIAVAGIVLLLVLPWLAQPSTESRLAQEIVSAHMRSLLLAHITDVTSTDQHTVKPWFNGKLNYSPPVVDPAPQGFPLIGGRVDVINEQTVAALVYQRRKHLINLFIWPTAGSSAEKVLDLRGYNIAHWTKDDMNFWAISDLSREELQEFARLAGSAPEK